MEYEVKVSYHFTDEDLKDIIITALEGGIGYWACLDNVSDKWGNWKNKPKDMPTSEYAWQILKEGGTLHFLDEEDEGAEYFMGLDDLLCGIKHSIESREYDGDMLDANIADIIIQYAIFGEVIYG